MQSPENVPGTAQKVVTIPKNRLRRAGDVIRVQQPLLYDPSSLPKTCKIFLKMCKFFVICTRLPYDILSIEVDN